MAKEVLELEVKSDISKTTKDVEKLDGATKKAKTGFGGMTTAIKGIGTAIKASGIGLLVGIVAKFMEVLSKNQAVVDFFNTSMTTMSIIFNDFITFVSENSGKVVDFFKKIFDDPVQSMKDFGQAIVDNVLERFYSFLDTLGHLASAVGNLLRGNFRAAKRDAKAAGKEMVDVMTGIDNSVDKARKTLNDWGDSWQEFGKAIETANKLAKELTRLEKAAGRAELKFQRLNATYLKDAEIQRQIRDDETNTFEQRIEANNKLSEVLAEQSKEQRKVVAIQVAAARAQWNINKSEENWLALEAERIKLLQVDEAITGQLSEQKTNQVALEKEQLEVQNQLRIEALQGTERELEELKVAYDQKVEMARRAGEDITEITKVYEAEQAVIRQTAIDDAEEKANEEKELAQSLANAKMGMAARSAQLIGQLAGEGTALAKTAAIAQATIAGVQGVQNAYTTAQSSPYTLVNPAYPLIQAGLAAGFSAIQIGKLMSGGKPDTSGGGGGGGVTDAAAPAPQMMSGAFTLGEGQAPDAMRAYVVTDEMTNSQNQLANIRRRATI